MSHSTVFPPTDPRKDSQSKGGNLQIEMKHYGRLQNAFIQEVGRKHQIHFHSLRHHSTLLINVLQSYCMDTMLHLEKNTKFQSQNRSTDTLLLFVLEGIKEGVELNFKCLDLLSVPLQNP